jgi:adenylate cyclase class 2
VDQVFDRADGELRERRSLLRVRSVNGTATLTYKGPPVSSTPYKSREELEATTTDVSPLFAILDRLGFELSFRYEKFRTVFAAPHEPGILALDETPIGVFLELEGPGDWIDATAQRLGWSHQDYVTLSYATLYREHREAYGGPPDMTF